MAGKVIVLVLLALSGLSEALKCYQCSGADGLCDGGTPSEVECPAPANGCAFSQTQGQTVKACGIKDEAFACVQGKLGQNGDCIRAKIMDVAQYLQECGFGVGSVKGQADAHSLVYSVFGNGTQVRQGKTQQDDMFIFCVCGSDLCNTDDLGEGEDESTSTQPSNPTDGSTAPSNPTDSNTDATSPGDGNTAPSTTPEDSGASVVGASALTVSGVILLMVNRLFH